jgi:RNAse (barnase) inhibitor barstar
MRLNNRQFVRCVSPSQKEGQFLKEETACKDYRLFEVDLMGIKTPQDLMNKIASALNFPSYFGGNWDAFLDMISDLTWNPASGYVVLWKSAEALLQLPGEQLAIFIRLCVAAVERWQSGEDEEGKAIPRTPFYFLLEGQASFCRLIADLMTNT